MCSTYSEIFSAAYLQLGQPTDDILSRLELSQIVQRSWSYRMEEVRQSEEGVILAKSEEFTLGNNEDEINLTEEIADFSIPMWVERQTITFYTHPIWEFVPTVNPNILQQYRNTYIPGVSFYGGNPAEVIAKFSYFGNEVQIAQSKIHRVWYLPNMEQPDSETTAIQLPNNIVNMLVYDTCVSAIPLMQMNMAKQVSNRPELRDQMEALKGLYLQYTMEQKNFEILFRKWATK